MEAWQENVQHWLLHPRLDRELKAIIEENKENTSWLIDGFYTNLAFGTGGMRGEIGPGTNRMNIYTIRKAARGLADYLLHETQSSAKVVIAYDSRHYSEQFALESAKVLGHEGADVFLFNALRPTPELSFAVRYLQADAGIVITASHNPAEYNGFKVYGSDGGQLPPKEADQLISYVNQIEDELAINTTEKDVLLRRQKLHMIGEEIDEAYTNALKQMSLQPSVFHKSHLSVVYTPLHGSGLEPFLRIVAAHGFQGLSVVEQQKAPDGGFPTVASPNPEEQQAFSLAMEQGKQMNADVLVATDPDADRVGLAVRNQQGAYELLSGNQTGALLLHYILEQRKQQKRLPENGIIFKTIVTSELGRAIAQHYGITTEDTLTGFKFIGEKIKTYNTDQSYEFLFGYEESYGYLIDDFVRDKDAIQAGMMAIEMAAHYKNEGKTLYEVLQEMYDTFGHYRESLVSITRKGKKGSEDIATLMAAFRENPPKTVGGVNVVMVEDYDAQKQTNLASGASTSISLPRSNVLKYKLENEAWVCLRPSGTEPKVKCYIGVKETSKTEAEKRLTALESDLLTKVHTLLDEER
ncbi:phospho-sugar mutase [Bacillaceae bacterium SIJ1]|uniref:phospho-sugar mutase n=1 Tax=Litoribacterium kuwaitense TaxID=1398745 RepID=UPI0013EE2FD0|nr:phospho-sugar mutase [Litoribacterium kuwaitense]NGP43876.1 phospho-sugar mutase [Litoribacterium kuwaitense]